jgi:hypothetical protein
MKSENPTKIDFTTFVLSLASTAMMALGLREGEKGQQMKDLALAEQNIELLELLFSKTKGNLTADEDRLIQQVLVECRMRYIDVKKS